MKNVTVFIFMLASTLLFISGCSNGNDESSEGSSESGVTELSFWAPFSGGDADFMKSMISDFNEEHEDVEVDYLTVTDDEYYTKFRTSVTSNQAPDIAIAHASRIAELQSANLIESIEGPAEEAGIDWDTYNENIVNATMIDDEHYGVPLDTHALIMFANKTILDEAGVLNDDGMPEVGEGAEGFKDFLTQIQENTEDDVFPLSATSSGYSPLRIWWTLYSQMGGELLNEEGTEAAFNNEEGLEALSYMGSLTEEELWPKNIQDGGEIFQSGNAGVHINGVWMTGVLEQNDDLDFVALPIPNMYEEEATWGDSHSFVLPTKQDQADEKREAAIQFSDWIAENAATWGEAGHVPSKSSVVESEEFQELEYRKDYAELTDYVSFTPSNENITAINDALADQLSTFTSGQTNEEETLEMMEQEVNNILSE
ncbi:ABC transporter substrate-binding protein [Halobacillus andaensis]|uniref:ABC transporter substrate-binding protein n=1 Tax=Halobacillus andaensis TaxID=1176239 RepID=A0A917B7A3_HALAA|nr:ABC transporter substrate-binding protein [Halobacillus andaensis]MBP2004321.1 multiple sugar transport system substrate-binding protein [Halobacillus andaensis]GGF22534.1 ABC transporter substrate-binding protein [Halobacillus andaensis]